MKFDLSKIQNLGIKKIKDIGNQGWTRIEFIEQVFKSWIVKNELLLIDAYEKVTGKTLVDKADDNFNLWLVDYIYLDIFCKTLDNEHLKFYTKKIYKN